MYSACIHPGFIQFILKVKKKILISFWIDPVILSEFPFGISLISMKTLWILDIQGITRLILALSFIFHTPDPCPFYINFSPRHRHRLWTLLHKIQQLLDTFRT